MNTYVKYGLIGAGLIVGGYAIYRGFAGPSEEEEPKKETPKPKEATTQNPIEGFVNNQTTILKQQKDLLQKQQEVLDLQMSLVNQLKS